MLKVRLVVGLCAVLALLSGAKGALADTGEVQHAPPIAGTISASGKSATVGKVGGNPLNSSPPPAGAPVPPPSTKSTTGNSGTPTPPPVATKTKRFSGRRCTKHGRRKTCTFYRAGKRYKVCVKTGRGRFHCRHVKLFSGHKCSKHGRRQTCTYYRAGNPYKICVRIGRGRRRCSTALPKTDAVAAPPGGQGYRAPLAAVGKIWRAPTTGLQGHCSGTMIGANVLLTAGHCLYSNDNSSSEDGFTGYIQQHWALYFTPDSTAGPNNGANAASPDVNIADAPYGWLPIVNSWVPRCYETPEPDGGSDDGKCDWGIAQIGAYSDGSYAGNLTGTFPIAWNFPPQSGQEFYLMGYPGTGAFAQPAADYGDVPYFCNDSYDGRLLTAAQAPLTGTGTYIDAWGCEMTGGASGGPVFTKLADGNWYINGVNNIGGWTAGLARTDPNAIGVDMAWSYFDSDFGTFYCSVFTSAQVCAQASSSARRSSAKPDMHAEAARRQR
jgi:hypothetical protein